MARLFLLDRLRRRAADASAPSPPRVLRRAPSPGAIRRERRAIVKARDERIRDLGGLTLEMYRRSSFRNELLVEQCREIVSLEERLHELDSMMQAVAVARRAPTTCDCGAPVPWGSHFCANCGRPVGGEPIVACEGCGHPLPADASFCANCGRPVETSAAEPEPQVEAEAGGEEEQQPAEQTILHASDPWEH